MIIPVLMTGRNQHHSNTMRYETKIRDEKFFGLDRPVKTRGCDCPGCTGQGEYRAPKSRQQLGEYYWFCLGHVREYNLNWDYYAGMNESEIEAHIRNDVCWQRETWPLGNWRQREAAAREKVAEEFFGEPAGEPFPANGNKRHHVPVAVIEALAVLELQAPVDFTRVKVQYKKLVKRHHPDANGGCPVAEARFKDINQAFTTLRRIYDAGDLT